MRTNLLAGWPAKVRAATWCIAVQGLGAIAAVGLLCSGCSGPQYAEPNPAHRFVFPGEQPPATLSQPATNLPGTPAPAPASASTTPAAVGNVGGLGLIRVGDSITVTFSDTPPNVRIEPIQVRIGEDGHIPLPLNQTIQAAGKTVRQLEKEIVDLYVPKFYKQMSVTVKTEERFYFVGGEVRNPNRFLYAGQITVLRAIDTAGGFTDFANRKRIELTRQDGRKIIVNYQKALKDPKLDPEVYPNDQIVVPRRLF
jgi:polysaccharide export outer membrane protein